MHFLLSPFLLNCPSHNLCFQPLLVSLQVSLTPFLALFSFTYRSINTITLHLLNSFQNIFYEKCFTSFILFISLTSMSKGMRFFFINISLFMSIFIHITQQFILLPTVTLPGSSSFMITTSSQERFLSAATLDVTPLYLTNRSSPLPFYLVLKRIPTSESRF